MPVGRPTKYTDDMPAKAMEVLSKGFPKQLLGPKLGVRPSTIYDWLDPKSPRFKEDFSDTVKEGERYVQAHWLTRAMDIMDTGQGNASIAIFGLKNIMGWRDKQDVTGTQTHNVQVVETGVPEKD